MKASSQQKNVAINLLLSLGAILLALLAGEGVLRLIYDPVNYLMPELENDPVLGIKVKAHSAGHDAWGFRNKSVPQRAEIVTIGDSQTYGISASAENSWPAQLERMLEKKVYNLSLGGYSPLEYLYLLKNKALLLHPSTVIVGLYLGNDLAGAYSNAYSRDAWKTYRFERAIADSGSAQGGHRLMRVNYRKRFLGNIRNWFAHHSILYRIAVYSLGDFFRFSELKLSSRNADATIYENAERGIKTGFTPGIRFTALNLGNPHIREGLQITTRVLEEMQAVCASHRVRLIVLLIPTKERVFAHFIYRNKQLANAATIDALIENEQKVNALLQARMREAGISYLDATPVLQKAVDREKIYPEDLDGHPNKNGYREIAHSIRQFLQGESASSVSWQISAN